MSPPADPAAEIHRPDGFGARIDGRLSAAGLTTPLRRDAALAALVALVSVVVVLLLLADPQVLAQTGFTPFQSTAVVVGLCAQGVMLCVRRIRPALCLVAVVLLQLAVLPLLPLGGTARGPAPLVAAYSCGSVLGTRAATWVVGAAALLETAGFVAATLVPRLTGPQADGSVAVIASVVAGQLISSALVYAVSALVGAYVATRRRYVDLLRASAAEAIEAQRTRADAAVGRERSRMARELHDIAAHHLSGMVVEAAVVEKLIDRDPEAAKRTAARVRRQGRETLQDLRQVVGTLRDPEPVAAGAGLAEDGAPVPGLAVLDGLVHRTRDTGTPVDLAREGVPRDLAPIADVTFYRVAQEALANARDHAPGATVRVLLRHADDVVLEVVNGPPDRRPAADRGHRGFGLIGMRERAQLVGAVLEAGPTADGGWRVRLRLPPDRADPGPPAGRSVAGEEGTAP